MGIGFTYYFEQTESDWLEDLSLGAEYDRYEWLDGDLDSEEFEWNVIGVRTLEGDYVGFEVEFEREILRSLSRSSMLWWYPLTSIGESISNWNSGQAVTVPFWRDRTCIRGLLWWKLDPRRNRAFLATIQIPSA